jgi:putative transposase
VRVLCRVLRVSESAYHAYRGGRSYVLSPQKAALAARVREVFDLHRRRYGARRIAAELAARGSRVGRRAVRTMMRREGLQALRPRRYVPRTTDSRGTTAPSPDLLLDAR